MHFTSVFFSAGWASRAYFSDNGSTAIEIALKMAFRKFSLDHGILISMETRPEIRVCFWCLAGLRMLVFRNVICLWRSPDRLMENTSWISQRKKEKYTI